MSKIIRAAINEEWATAARFGHLDQCATRELGDILAREPVLLASIVFG
ncbi:MAG: hypothetical protein HIU92_10910 [Proteobacteria bacterium]|nr:hypothetical protein [Pseudomonadota bacterium]